MFGGGPDGGWTGWMDDGVRMDEGASVGLVCMLVVIIKTTHYLNAVPCHNSNSIPCFVLIDIVQKCLFYKPTSFEVFLPNQQDHFVARP